MYWLAECVPALSRMWWGGPRKIHCPVDNLFHIWSFVALQRVLCYPLVSKRKLISTQCGGAPGIGLPPHFLCQVAEMFRTYWTGS